MQADRIMQYIEDFTHLAHEASRGSSLFWWPKRYICIPIFKHSLNRNASSEIWKVFGSLSLWEWSQTWEVDHLYEGEVDCSCFVTLPWSLQALSKEVQGCHVVDVARMGLDVVHTVLRESRDRSSECITQLCGSSNKSNGILGPHRCRPIYATSAFAQVKSKAEDLSYAFAPMSFHTFVCSLPYLKGCADSWLSQFALGGGGRLWKEEKGKGSASCKTQLCQGSQTSIPLFIDAKQKRGNLSCNPLSHPTLPGIVYCMIDLWLGDSDVAFEITLQLRPETLQLLTWESIQESGLLRPDEFQWLGLCYVLPGGARYWTARTPEACTQLV